jgi:hypothetical protein
MTPAIDIDSILANAEWEQWRTRQYDPATLAAAARAWCTSRYWRRHTPRLENWKIVVSDLASESLNEEAILAMAAANEHHLPFPTIPLFESEQIQDLCGILRDADAAVALAERLEENRYLLTIDPSEAAQRCWDYVSLSAKKGIDYSAWTWMFSGRDFRSAPLPSREGVAGLTYITSPRRAAALNRLEEVLRERARREAPAVPSAPAVPDERTARQARNQRLAGELFDRSAKFGEWEQVQAELRGRTAGFPGPHPLVEMTRYLREHDFPASLDETAWGRLQNVFRAYPKLLETDNAGPDAPLPALELALCVRSTTSPGRVMLDLLPFAGAYLRSASWWRAVRLALEPMSRRGGWRNANDSWETALRVVKLRARGLDPAEASAMREGLSTEGMGDSFNGQ